MLSYFLLDNTVELKSWIDDVAGLETCKFLIGLQLQ